MELFKIPTGSMIPTLRIGDFILVNKYAYGLKFPFSDITYFSRKPDPIYLTEQKPVERGDVIVFKYPKDPSINYIKRVIGIPGDTVEIKDKFVFINGTKIEVSKVSGQDLMKTMDEKYRDNNLSFYQAEFKNKSFIYQIDNDNFFKVDFDKITIPKGQFFVMGDNRDFSYDSRYWGLVPRSHLVGKAIVVWLSIDFNPSGKESLELRSDRIGHLIQ
jgi:signal peptidase I